MLIADFTLLLKKIAVGVVVAAIPLVIIIGGLTLTRLLLAHRQPSGISVTAHPQP